MNHSLPTEVRYFRNKLVFTTGLRFDLACTSPTADRCSIVYKTACVSLNDVQNKRLSAEPLLVFMPQGAIVDTYTFTLYIYTHTLYMYTVYNSCGHAIDWIYK